MKCPVCGVNMDMNLRKDENFVQDEHWYEMSLRINKDYPSPMLEIENKTISFDEDTNKIIEDLKE